MEDSLKYTRGFFNDVLGTCNLCYEEIAFFAPEELASEFNKLQLLVSNEVEYRGIICCPSCGAYEINYREEDEF